jgi:hypothetical protein
VRRTLSTAPTAPPELEQQLEQLQAELSTRSSTFHFAHAGVSMVFALIVAGAAGKLGWDSKHLWAAFAVAVLSVALWAYGLVHYQIGKAHLRRELERFEVLKSLRRTLHLDDPSALLPQ